MRLAQPDWLAHRLTVTGPAKQVAAFRRAAAGSGIVPWWWDHDALAEDWFHLLMTAPHRGISATGARLLAHALRDAVQEAHDRAAARIDRRSCPFDLNALRPVPPALLRRGADDPASLDWLWRHWGTTWPLRRVEVLVPELEGFRCSFCAADWTPWPALAWLRARFPALHIEITPLYGGGL
jgi:hypothetical protein